MLLAENIIFFPVEDLLPVLSQMADICTQDGASLGGWGWPGLGSFSNSRGCKPRVVSTTYLSAGLMSRGRGAGNVCSPHLVLQLVVVGWPLAGCVLAMLVWEMCLCHANGRSDNEEDESNKETKMTICAIFVVMLRVKVLGFTHSGCMEAGVAVLVLGLWWLWLAGCAAGWLWAC